MRTSTTSEHSREQLRDLKVLEHRRALLTPSPLDLLTPTPAQFSHKSHPFCTANKAYHCALGLTYAVETNLMSLRGAMMRVRNLRAFGVFTDAQYKLVQQALLCARRRAIAAPIAIDNKE